MINNGCQKMGDLADEWRAFQMLNCAFSSLKQVKIQSDIWTTIYQHVLCENTSTPLGRVMKNMCNEETPKCEKTKLGT